MSTKPDNMPWRLSLKIKGKLYRLTVTPEGFELVPKGKRKGVEMPWSAFISDDALLYSDLQASIRKILGTKK